MTLKYSQYVISEDTAATTSGALGHEYICASTTPRPGGRGRVKPLGMVLVVYLVVIVS